MGGGMSGLEEQIAEYNRTRRSPGEPLMTQKRLADIVGTSPSLVNRHLHGQDMMLSSAARYAKALRCLVDDLLFNVHEIPAPVSEQVAFREEAA